MKKENIMPHASGADKSGGSPQMSPHGLLPCIKRHKRLALFVAVLVALNVIFLILKRFPLAATFYTDHISGPLKRLFAAALSVLPFSLAEAEVVLVLPAALIFTAAGVAKALRSKEYKSRAVLACLSRLASAVLAVFTAFNMLWGINYYSLSFKQRSGIAADGCTVDELAAATAHFALLVNETAPYVPRDGNGLYREDVDGIFDRCTVLFRSITDEFPFLDGLEVRPKGVILSEQLSMINTTGITFPFTGECCVNTHAPMCFIPVTAAHETAHQRNVASEDEANFVAVLACLASDDMSFRYSGSLFGYLLLSNALYSADKDTWAEIGSSLCSEARADLSYNNAYWRHYKGEASETADRMYDGLLKTYGNEDGIKSYGAAADLLTAYFKDKQR